MEKGVSVHCNQSYLDYRVLSLNLNLNLNLIQTTVPVHLAAKAGKTAGGAG